MSGAAGAAIETITLNGGGLRAELLTLGATLRRLEVPDRDGRRENVLLGHRDLDDYRTVPRRYGSTVGRFANRIACGRFMLDGVEYRLPVSDPPHNLHSGPIGFDRLDWQVVRRSDDAVRFALESPDGWNGFPGRLCVTLDYALDAAGLAIDFLATTDRPTIVNLTNHAYFNLQGEASGRSALDHLLRIDAAHYTPVDDTMIPTGSLQPVADTPFDFRAPTRLGARIDADDDQLRRALGYDHNFVLTHAGGALRRAATLFDPGSGRVLDVRTTAPGLQLYSGNHLKGGPAGTSGRIYAPRDGVCLEAQHFPDSPNQPHFPSPRLDPGETYRHSIRYDFRTAGDREEAFPG